MVRLLRRLARGDRLTGLSPARLSALSILVFKGPLSLGQLARYERVKPPTMSLIVRGLKNEGLVKRRPHPGDGRAIEITATRKGKAALRRGRQQRLNTLTALLKTLSPAQQQSLGEAADLLQQLAMRPAGPE